MGVDSKTFKAAMSRWSSGIAIITARGDDGELAGITANSFTSLSLDPPMVLFCLGLDSTSFDLFDHSETFAANILAAGQEALSNHFAASGGDKFATVEFQAGNLGAPLLPGCLAALECRVHGKFPGGDHVIFVGEVEAVSLGEGAPLMYYRGGYRSF